MNSDFRVNVGFVDHPKMKRARRALGERTVEWVVRLWSFTAMNKPDGIFRNMTAADIADAAGWPEERIPSDFIDALRSSGLLDCGTACVNQGAAECEPETYCYHNWVEVNAWAAHAPERSAKARTAAVARWGKSRSHDAAGPNEQCTEDARSITPSPILPPSHIHSDASSSPNHTGRERSKTITVGQAIFQQGEINKWRDDNATLWVGGDGSEYRRSFKARFKITPEKWDALYETAMADASIAASPDTTERDET
jgi:hypothetical protein